MVVNRTQYMSSGYKASTGNVGNCRTVETQEYWFSSRTGSQTEGVLVVFVRALQIVEMCPYIHHLTNIPNHPNN